VGLKIQRKNLRPSQNAVIPIESLASLETLFVSKVISVAPTVFGVAALAMERHFLAVERARLDLSLKRVRVVLQLTSSTAMALLVVTMAAGRVLVKTGPTSVATNNC